MSKIVYATPEESARAIKPDTRTEAQKILYKLQAEQTHDFEMGHVVDNGAIALKLIEQNLELLEALQFLLAASGEQLTTAFEQAQEVIAKATGQSK